MSYRRLFRSNSPREWEITYEYTNWEGKRVTESQIVGARDLEKALDSVAKEFADPKYGYKMLYFEEYFDPEY